VLIKVSKQTIVHDIPKQLQDATIRKLINQHIDVGRYIARICLRQQTPTITMPRVL
jgi:hypothetical protein